MVLSVMADVFFRSYVPEVYCADTVRLELHDSLKGARKLGDCYSPSIRLRSLSFSNDVTFHLTGRSLPTGTILLEFTSVQENARPHLSVRFLTNTTGKQSVW